MTVHVSDEPLTTTEALEIVSCATFHITTIRHCQKVAAKRSIKWLRRQEKKVSLGDGVVTASCSASAIVTEYKD